MGRDGEDTAEQVSGVVYENPIAGRAYHVPESPAGRGIICISKRFMLDAFFDREWLLKMLPDVKIMDVQYSFERGAFAFVVESSFFAKLRDGETLPVLIGEPSIGQPPPYIIDAFKKRIEELEEQIHEFHLGEGETDTVVALRKELAVAQASMQLGRGGMLSKLQKDNPHVEIVYDFDTGRHLIQQLKSGEAGQYKADLEFKETKSSTATFWVPSDIAVRLGAEKLHLLEQDVLTFYRLKLQELR